MQSKKTLVANNDAASPQSSAWVSANAGSGKTHLLTQRILRLLLSGAQPGQILCISYTNAACVEIILRVQKSLAQWVQMPLEQLRAALNELTGQPPGEAMMRRARTAYCILLEDAVGLRVQTIHAFCQSVLRKFPLESGVAPFFSPLDPHQAQLLQQEALLRLFSEAKQQPQPVQLALKTLLEESSEFSLRNTLQTWLGQRLALQPLWDEARGDVATYRMWLNAVLPPRYASLEEAKMSLFTYTDNERNTLLDAVAVLASSSKKDIKLSQTLAHWFEYGNAATYATELLIEGGGIPKQIYTSKSNLTEAQKSLIDREAARAHDFWQEMQASQVRENTLNFLLISEAVNRHYDQLKHTHAWLDYDDFIAHTARLLSAENMASWVLYKLDGGLKHVLLDEAQDTSHAQWNIARTLLSEFFAGETAQTGTRTLFAVGDEKQSIFSFQGAAVERFAGEGAHYAKIAAQSGQHFLMHPLQHNYRSAPMILEFVDRICAQPVMRSALGRNGQEEGAIAHIAKRDYPGRVEHWNRAEKQPDSSQPLEAALAEQIAQRIEKMLQEKQALAGEILILVRKRGAFAPLMMRALKQRNLPVGGADRMVLRDHLLVRDLLALAKFALLPEDDLNLAALFKSPLCNLTEEQLFALAHSRAERSLWQQLRQAEDSHPDLKKTSEFLQAMLARADFMPVFEFFHHALDVAHKRDAITQRFGAESLEILSEFLMQTLLFEEKNIPSLQHFVQWMEDYDGELIRAQSQKNESIRIMTVHGAKGLEADIVFLVDAEKLPQAGAQLLWAQGKLGEKTLQIPLRPNKSKHNDSITLRWHEAEEQRIYEEYLRLLYVGITRAKRQLILCGWKPYKNPPERPTWHDLAAAAFGPDAQEDEAGKWVEQGTQPQFSAPFSQQKNSPANAPAWLLQPAPTVEASAATREKASPTWDSVAADRGVLVHLLLQQRMALPLPLRHHEIGAHIAARAPEISATMRDDIAQEVRSAMHILEQNLPADAKLFFEVGVAGNLPQTDKTPIIRQLDLLCITPQEAWVVDYKTHENPPDSTQALPMSIRDQLASYAHLVANLYPTHRVRCFVLWTRSASWMEINMAPTRLGLDERAS